MAKQYLLTLLWAAPCFVVWTLLDMWRLRQPMDAFAEPGTALLDDGAGRPSDL